MLEVVHHFVLTGFRLDEIRVSVDVIDEFVSVFAHFEEICFFFCRYTWAAAVRAFAVYELGLCEEGFTRGTVQSFLVSFVDISLIVQYFENLLYLIFMICI